MKSYIQKICNVTKAVKVVCMTHHTIEVVLISCWMCSSTKTALILEHLIFPLPASIVVGIIQKQKDTESSPYISNFEYMEDFFSFPREKSFMHKSQVHTILAGFIEVKLTFTQQRANERAPGRPQRSIHWRHTEKERPQFLEKWGSESGGNCCC